MSEPSQEPSDDRIIVHGTCVALFGQGVLILGASGSGKSSLALHLMALGAELVSDDRTVLTPDVDAVIATCPAPIAGMIEARGVGLLAAHSREQAPVRLVIDLDQIEKARLPDPREVEIAGRVITCLHKVDAASFPAAIVQLMKGGRVSPT